MDKVIQALNKFDSTGIFTAIRQSTAGIMAVVMIASLFLLIAAFPLQFYESFMNGNFGVGWNSGFKAVASALFSVVSLLAAFGTAYSYAKNQEQDGIPAGVLALVSFVIVSSKDNGTQIFFQEYSGVYGMFTAFIIGIGVGAVYSFLLKKNITIKMPDGIPHHVGSLFASMLPGTIILLLAMFIYYASAKIFGTTFAEVVYKNIQVPVQHFSDTWLFGAVIIVLMSSLFWTGIHGAGTVMNILTPILTTNALSNQAILDSGLSLTRENGAYLMTAQLIDCFVKFGGVGLTMSFLLAVIFFARSKGMKEVYKNSIGSGWFNINEPVIFGLPIVNNNIMRLPFIAAPFLAYIVTYGAQELGFLAPFAGIHVPWITPPILSGFLLGGIRGAIVQLVIIVLAAIIYLPFVIRQDREFLEQEAEEEKI